MFKPVIAAALELLNFTSPHGHSGGIVTRYLVQRGNDRQGWVAASFYRSPTDLSEPTPKPPGAAESVWVAVTQDPNNAFGWRNGGSGFRLWYVTDIDTSGQLHAWPFGMDPYAVHDTIGPSNVVALAEALPDTNVTDGRTWVRAAGGRARFRRSFEDGGFDPGGPIFTQEQYATLRRTTLCTIFGFYALAGARVSCNAAMGTRDTGDIERQLRTAARMLNAAAGRMLRDYDALIRTLMATP